MQPQTTYLLMSLGGLFISMFVIIPRRVVPRLSHIGFWFGFVQALIILWLGQVYLGLFRVIGDPTVFGIPLILSLAWIPPVILFAYYFTTMADTTVKKLALVLFFAVASAVAQYLLELAGVWQSLNWNPFFTFLLAIVTHSIITTYLIRKGSKLQFLP